MKKVIKKVAIIGQDYGGKHTVCDDILYRRWYNQMLQVGSNAVSAAFGLNFGELRKNEEACKLMLEAMEETI